MNAPATLARCGRLRAPPSLASLDLDPHAGRRSTRTSRDSNLALIDWVRGYLAGTVSHIDADVRRRTRKANLFARCPRGRQDDARRRRAVAATPTSCPSTASRGTRDPFVVTLEGRSALRPRRHRHEELFRRSGSVRARVLAARIGQPVALRAVLRRGDRLHRRAPADRRHRRARRACPRAASSASRPGWSSLSRTRAR